MGTVLSFTLSSIKVKVEIEDDTKELSVGQTINLRSHPNEDVRKKAHFALEAVWKEKEGLFAQILNHIAGFRLQVYKKRGIENILTEPLIDNRLKEKTLNAMWKAVSKYQQPFINYLNQKAKINGYKKMKAYNFWAPIAVSDQKIDCDDAISFILEQYSHFGTELEILLDKHLKMDGWKQKTVRINHQLHFVLDSLYLENRESL